MSEKGETLMLGIEAGGTRTVALLTRLEGQLVHRAEFGPGNLRVLDDVQLEGRFSEIARTFPTVAAIGVGMAGLRDKQDQARLAKVISECWPGVPFQLSNDLESALRAATVDPKTEARVIVLSGTGSCCFGRSKQGKTAKVGGWGHILGDKGSGYEIGLRALKAIVFYLDRDEEWTRLGQRVLRTLSLNEPNELIVWVQKAGKDEIAGLAKEVFAAAEEKDRIARDILEGAASSLAKDAVNCAARICRKGSRVKFILTGGVLLKQDKFGRQVRKRITESWPNSVVEKLERDSAWGAVDLALEAYRGFSGNPGRKADHKKPVGKFKPPGPIPLFWPKLDSKKAPTEQRNPRSLNLPEMTAEEFLELMLSEEKRIMPALLKEKAGLAQAAEIAARALISGGRLFYVGAGTSGRLGVLDASECPPTFRADPEQVQGIIAGGQRALWQAVEGAEDDPEAGRAAVGFRGVKKGDVLVGIAASGRTPFVWGALAAAKNAQATTILLCFNPSLEIPNKQRPNLVIAPNLGPEVLTGSTRLKSGTATKLVLNIISTFAMVRLGKVVSNLMVDLNPSNVKLRDRAVRIVRELTGVSAVDAERALQESGWVVKKAWQRLEGNPSKTGRAKY